MARILLPSNLDWGVWESGSLGVWDWDITKLPLSNLFRIDDWNDETWKLASSHTVAARYQ